MGEIRFSGYCTDRCNDYAVGVSNGYAMSVCYHVSYWSCNDLYNEELFAEYNDIMLEHPNDIM